MPAENIGEIAIVTHTNSSVVVQVAGSVNTHLLAIDINGHASINLFSGGGTSISAVGSALSVDITTQSVPLKTSRDGAAPTAANANYAEVVVAGAALAANNPLSVRVSADGTNYAAVNHPIFVELSDGTNPLGTNSNPLYTQLSSAGGGTAVYGSTFASPAWKNDSSIAAGSTANHDYTVTTGKTLTLKLVTVSSSGTGKYQVILDQGGTPNTIDVLHVPSGGGDAFRDYSALNITLGSTKVLRIAKLNNEISQATDMFSAIFGTEN